MVSPIIASGVDPITHRLAELMSTNLSPQGLEQLMGRQGHIDSFTTKGGMSIDLNSQPAVNSNPQTAGPHRNVQSSREQTGPTYYRPLTEVGSIKMEGSDKPFTGEHLKNSLDKGLNSPNEQKVANTRAFMKKHNIIQDADGNYMVGVQGGQAPQGMASFEQMFPGFNGASAGMEANIGGDIFGSLQRNSWALPVLGFLGGGVTGAVGMWLGAKMLKGTAAGFGSGNALAPGLMSLGSGGGSGSMGSWFNRIGGAGSYGGMSMVAQMAGFEGAAFNMRSIMNSYVADLKDSAMIANLNNQNIPIEDLIFMFTAYMGDKYEDKLREKMQEAALAEKAERRRDREEKKARMVGGMLSVFGPIGTVLGSGYEYVTMEKNRIRDAMDGNLKSSTILMQEVQMLMHKWKQMNELLSNLMKAMHDMAMTPIRNVR